MTKEEIRQKIERLKSEVAVARGTPCEVYSRVVGYLRPVQSWNKGKKEEFKLRKVYTACTNKKAVSTFENGHKSGHSSS